LLPLINDYDIIGADSIASFAYKNELLKDVSSWNMNADGLYKQSAISSNVKLSGQQNLLLKYSVVAPLQKRKNKA